MNGPQERRWQAPAFVAAEAVTLSDPSCDAGTNRSTFILPFATKTAPTEGFWILSVAQLIQLALQKTPFGLQLHQTQCVAIGLAGLVGARQPAQ